MIMCLYIIQIYLEGHHFEWRADFDERVEEEPVVSVEKFPAFVLQIIQQK